MTDINEIDLRLIDTSILMIFLGIMRHRQATAVAREMNLTQPAISHALKRLRALYDDPLFLRQAHGLEPTALARELEPKIRRIVRLLSETLAPETAFDPKTATRELRIGAFDYEAVTIVPDLVATLQAISPGIAVHSLPLIDREALSALVEGRLDLAVGYFDFLPTDKQHFVADPIYEETYVVAARKGHRLFSGDVTLERYAPTSQLIISPSGPTKTMVDYALQLQGLVRNVQVSVPSLFPALSIVENSDFVVTLPRRVARKNTNKFNIDYAPLPLGGGTFTLHAVRHRRDANSPVHKWLTETIAGIVG